MGRRSLLWHGISWARCFDAFSRDIGACNWPAADYRDVSHTSKIFLGVNSPS